MSTEKLNKYENLHILFWLIKDTCWMLQFKWIGIAMILPTLTIALIIVFYTKSRPVVYINLAILFWITANSSWMYIEFFTDGHLKQFTTIPFALGFLFVGLFYYKTVVKKHFNSCK